MPLAKQALLAATIAASIVGNFIALTPPNPSKGFIPDDSWYFVADPNFLVLTLVPFGLLALIICIGVPSRLVSYASLGKNLTFDLAVPDRLITDGIYQYLQHPSYMGSLILVFSNTMLLLRIDGALSYWIPSNWYRTVRKLWCWSFAPLWFSVLILGMRTRVSQEESMMLATFGSKWERWHATTARFIPGVF